MSDAGQHKTSDQKTFWWNFLALTKAIPYLRSKTCRLVRRPNLPTAKSSRVPCHPKSRRHSILRCYVRRVERMGAKWQRGDTGFDQSLLNAERIMPDPFPLPTPLSDKRRKRRMGRNDENLGPLELHSSGTYRSVSPEVFVLPGNFERRDVTAASARMTVSFDTGTVLPDGTYDWIDVAIRPFGGGSGQSNGSRLVVEATLEFTPSRIDKGDEESPIEKGSSGNKVPVTTPLVGDLGITIDWDEPIGDDPYGLLEATKMVYPLP